MISTLLGYNVADSFADVGSTDQVINGNSFNVQSAELPWSINKFRNIYRFKVNQGEARDSDTGAERSELSNGDTPFNHGTSIWVAYSFKVDTGDTFDGITQILGQFHAGVSSPNFSFRMPFDDNFRVYLRTGDADAYTQNIAYTDSSFVRGDWYHVVVNAKFTSDTTGFIHVWINGTQVVDVNDYMTGYQEIQSTSNYWKFGVYRSTSVPPVEIVRYANMELGTADLSSRILSPTPI